MVYEIIWEDSAKKKLEKLDSTIHKQIIKKMDSIVDEPLLYVKKLVGVEAYRLRVGSYRVIMLIEKNKLIILVLELEHRSKVYKN